MHNFVITAPKPECVSDPECPVHLACIGQKCRDPCIPEQCGDRAICRVNNHRAVCVCPPPLEGNPYTACIEREYGQKIVKIMIVHVLLC